MSGETCLAKGASPIRESLGRPGLPKLSNRASRKPEWGRGKDSTYAWYASLSRERILTGLAKGDGRRKEERGFANEDA